MLNKFIILIMSFFSLLGISIGDINTETELVKFINDNIPVMRQEYYDEFGIDWNVSEFRDYKVLYDIDENEYAYIIRFNVGYLVVTEELELIEVNIIDESPIINYDAKTYLFGNNYYIKINESYIPNAVDTPDWGTIGGEGLFISDIYHDYTSAEISKLTYFSVTVSLANDLADKNGNYGAYSVYTRNQGSTTDCGPQAGTNMIYTYDFSGLTNVAKSNNSDTELANMRTAMGWTTSGINYLGLVFVGTWPGDFMSGLSSYMGADYYMVETMTYDEEAPAVGLYYNLNVTDTAHYALIIGKAQSDNWWIFKYNWDLISTWTENYNHTSGVIGTKKAGTPSYHFVKSSYRQGTYALYERNYPKWYEVWIPYGEVVKK